MKYYLYAAFALMLLGGCKKERTPSAPATIDSYIAANYAADAQMLLARLYVNGALEAGADEVKLNTAQLVIIEERLSAVYRLHTAVTDSIFNTLKLHTYANLNLKSIELDIDSSSAEGKRVVDYLPSGNAGFDELMSKYGFSYVRPSIPISNGGFVTITSQQSWNIQALLEKFKTYSFVLYADDNSFTGDGNDITYELDGNDTLIAFQLKSDDCIDFCEIVKSWRFKVDANGTATFLGEN
jgi:hypothetical protein